MDWFTLFLVVSVALYLLKVQEQRQRVLLLASFLGGTQIEKLLGTLMDGYLRAAGEQDPQRQAQVWAVLAQNEEKLLGQFQRFADDFAQVPDNRARVSTLPLRLWRREHDAAAAQGTRLHHDGRADADAAHLPLVLQVAHRGVGAADGPPQEQLRTGVAVCGTPNLVRLQKVA